jgi:farnesyl diphosphate synthase
MQGIAQRMEAVLERLLPPADEAPERLHAAMRYAALGGGKRARPLLAFAAGELTGAPPQRVERAAAAVEFIHAYSLVHDDMPCMDDDVLRRGQPTVHVKFDEATALLVGDALQSQAFEVLAGEDWPDVPQREMLLLLAQASGSRGMAGGQAIDLASVGARLDRDQLERMHRLKTGALLRASVLLGAWCGRRLTPDEQNALDAYAASVGLAFQVADDILDVEADTATLGKTAGKDAEHGKPTYVSILGLEESKHLAEELRLAAHRALGSFGESALRLRQLADFIVRRRH